MPSHSASVAIPQCSQQAAVEHICKEPGGLFICEHVLRVRNAEVVLAEDTAFEPVIVSVNSTLKSLSISLSSLSTPPRGWNFTFV